MDKMFKSARYYFTKKNNKIEPKQRRQYIKINRELLEAMDKHIGQNIYNTNYKPKNGFSSFCEENEDIIKVYMDDVLEREIDNDIDIKDKIKKTYKNRYFKLKQIKNKE
jgi:hypothetical protein